MVAKLSVYGLPRMFDIVGISVGVGVETHVPVYFGNVRNCYVAIEPH